ncbi:acetate kinase [Lactococcus taiwanensis]|jgi:acetate kinase|uniref:Acetate kinase n=1 Tax=Lactococcus taiwanensis TaxID=1151742 RepID=A0AA45KFZ6_9LACT|nr:acetate kinase [Lactococcus taiwanensis]KZK36980.1 Acetate kinase [Lactococcus cremoris]QSE76658.1 acetate kinase [Lactococcus taiwanensis]
MEKTLAVNAGSSSLKWQLYEMPEEVVIAKGIFERIGLPGSVSTTKFNDEAHVRKQEIVDHRQAVLLLMDELIHFKLIREFREITGIGHRVVAGGEFFKGSTIITAEVLEEIKALSTLAPLHNPANVLGIEAFQRLLPEALAVAVFDTAFHATLPEKAYRYPIPTKYYTDYAIRKYGAHGTSHMYVAQEAAKVLGRPLEELKLITAHIGNGVSITANHKGQSVDTSMGFTPLAGVMMGTRAGEMDASIIPYMLESDPSLRSAQEVIDILNKESGVLGVSELSSDMRDLSEAVAKGDKKAILAYEMYVDRLKKYIAQYFGVLNGADALVFTAGVGENDTDVRKDIVEGLSWFGMEIDASKNIRGAFGEISTPSSKVKVLVVPTNEELVIARDVEAAKA